MNFAAFLPVNNRDNILKNKSMSLNKFFLQFLNSAIKLNFLFQQFGDLNFAIISDHLVCILATMMGRGFCHEGTYVLGVAVAEVILETWVRVWVLIEIHVLIG